jgi:hypothetical protein
VNVGCEAGWIIPYSGTRKKEGDSRESDGLSQRRELERPYVLCVPGGEKKTWDSLIQKPLILRVLKKSLDRSDFHRKMG